MTLKVAARLALDFLLPVRCLSCDRRVSSEHGLCASCWQKMPFYEKPWCYRLGTPFSYDMGAEVWSPRAIASPPEFGRLRSVAAFEGPARDLVHGLKFGGRRDLAGPMGSWMARAGQELLTGESLIVPVPLHWSRLIARRFNQSADLARAVAGAGGGRFEPMLLRRSRRTRRQVGLSSADRRKNVRTAFTVSDDRLADLQGRHVILIDDVITTGSTVTACCRTLLGAGAESVDVLTFAHADVAGEASPSGGKTSLS
ncbi:ComF family protein [Rhodobacterales bacterium]|nr:ComF family protein [Rhodobacterales bacterium]